MLPLLPAWIWGPSLAASSPASPPRSYPTAAWLPATQQVRGWPQCGTNLLLRWPAPQGASSPSPRARAGTAGGPAGTLGKDPLRPCKASWSEGSEMGSAAHSTPGWARADTLCSWKDACGDAACPLLRRGFLGGSRMPLGATAQPQAPEFCSPGSARIPLPGALTAVQRPGGSCWASLLRGPPLWAYSLWWKLPEPRGPAGWDPALSSG